MAIPIGKLALYTAACGIHPALTLPVSLDVGTDNPALLADPLYLGHRAPRLRGPEYDELVEAFVAGVREVWPGCVIQWEDFKQGNALRILDRYRDRGPSFNDDVQGTSAVVVAGILTGMRALGTAPADQRIVLAGAGGAGIGIARLIHRAMSEDGMTADARRGAVVLVDSHGLVHEGRTDLDDTKRPLAMPADVAAAYGLASEPGGEPPGLLATVRAVRPTILVGTTGVAGSFSEEIVRAVAAGTDRPIVMPLSNPTSAVEAAPVDVLRWTAGRALVATGSPFAPVEVDGHDRPRVIGQANNVFVFPGLGLGTIVAEARAVSDGMVLAAARELASAVTDERIADGALFPPVAGLREVSHRIAVVVARRAMAEGLSPLPPETDFTAEVDAAMWWPDYAPYRPAVGLVDPEP
jgi:malic enzyme